MSQFLYSRPVSIATRGQFMLLNQLQNCREAMLISTIQFKFYKLPQLTCLLNQKVNFTMKTGLSGDLILSESLQIFLKIFQYFCL